jgi:hypothetical protein
VSSAPHRQVVLTVRTDGQLDMIWDSGDFVSRMEYDELHAKYESTVNILQQTESYVAELEARLK